MVPTSRTASAIRTISQNKGYPNDECLPGTTFYELNAELSASPNFRRILDLTRSFTGHTEFILNSFTQYKRQFQLNGHPSLADEISSAARQLAITTTILMTTRDHNSNPYDNSRSQRISLQELVITTDILTTTRDHNGYPYNNSRSQQQSLRQLEITTDILTITRDHNGYPYDNSRPQRISLQ